MTKVKNCFGAVKMLVNCRLNRRVARIPSQCLQISFAGITVIAFWLQKGHYLTVSPVLLQGLIESSSMGRYSCGIGFKKKPISREKARLMSNTTLIGTKQQGIVR